MNQEGGTKSDASDAQSDRGILRRVVGEAELAAYDWQQELDDIDGSSVRLGHVAKLSERAAALEGESPLNAAVLRLLAAVISMHLMVGTSVLFGPAIQMSNRRSAAPEDLDERDLAALMVMAEQASAPWLRARLADVGLLVAQVHKVPGWKLGQIAARAYLEHAKSGASEHPVERRESLQRAMALGRPFLRRDEEFHTELWQVAMTLLRTGLTESMPGVSVPIAHEIIQRNSALASEAGALFDAQAEKLFGEGASPLAADTFREAAKLWNAAKDVARAQASLQRSADVLIALARGPGQAMLQADWMAEGIAILRRNRGDRTRIRELQMELAEIRTRITGEMSSISHSVDVSEILSHVRMRVSSDNFCDALLQLAFAFSQWVDAGEVRQRVIKTAEEFVFSSMFCQVTYDEHGVPVAVTQPFDAANEDELEKRVVQHVAQFDHPLLARVAIPCAIDLLQTKFEPTMGDIMGLLHESPVTPRGHEWTLARGILAGLNHDWSEVAVFLIPQAEPFIRSAFKRHGVHTLAANAEGAEEEKSLSELLAHPEVSSVLAPDIVLELKTLLTHKSGHNLRNLYGHGLISDDDLPSVGTIILWWTMLRLILWPYRGRVIELIEQAAATAVPVSVDDDQEANVVDSAPRESI
ncbi:DUF4209 domain-containing protein [Stenotrophomonas pavanii]|uniref:DUF4209 domain-containing protein n=1 Tax=Stenotrophomonas pavanii TaxID=487698 RepID=UPI0039C62597